MLKHIVMWKLKDEAEGNSKAVNAGIMKKKLEFLKGRIDVIRNIEVGINFEETKGSFDVVLLSEFDSKEDLQSYAVHPDHKEAGAFIGKVTKDRAAVDYIV